MRKLQDALIDNRPREEVEKDYCHEEIVASSVSPDYSVSRAVATKLAERYELENQFATSSCAAHAGVRCLSILQAIYKRLAPAFIYRLRSNYPNEGMFVHNLGAIGKEYGAPDYDLLPTPRTESQINSVRITQELKDNAYPNRGGDYISIYDKHIDSYAQVVNSMYLPCTLFVWGNFQEWGMEVPEILDPNLTLVDAPVRHLVTIVPGTAHIYRGEKYVTILDSSTFGNIYIRHVSEDWIRERTVMGLYWLQLPEKMEGLDLPRYTFNRDLWHGMRDPEVVKLQDALKALGHFPRTQESTGYFGGITLKAVKDFQDKYSSVILRVIGLDRPTGYFGARTRAKMNKILNQ